MCQINDRQLDKTLKTVRSVTLRLNNVLTKNWQQNSSKTGARVIGTARIVYRAEYVTVRCPSLCPTAMDPQHSSKPAAASWRIAAGCRQQQRANAGSVMLAAYVGS